MIQHISINDLVQAHSINDKHQSQSLIVYTESLQGWVDQGNLSKIGEFCGLINKNVLPLRAPELKGQLAGLKSAIAAFQGVRRPINPERDWGWSSNQAHRLREIWKAGWQVGQRCGVYVLSPPCTARLQQDNTGDISVIACDKPLHSVFCVYADFWQDIGSARAGLGDLSAIPLHERPHGRIVHWQWEPCDPKGSHLPLNHHVNFETRMW